MTPAELNARLQAGPLLLDGGLGSLFIEMGLEPGQAPEGWLISRPERIAAAHARYVQAGSHVIHTVTFGATPPKLAASGLAGRCDELNRLAVRLAREAAGTQVLVAGDVGPTGRFLAPTGDASEDELQEAFAEQCAALACAGADLLSIETMYDLREALAAVRAATATGLGVVCSMTFDIKRRGVFTFMGDSLVPSLQALRDAGAIVVGCNCTVTSGAMADMLLRARQALPDVWLAAQPNAGQPVTTPAGVCYEADPEVFARDLMQMVRAGVRVVGGCCGTDDRFIRAIRTALDARELG
ncbi:MAG: homocysteine S-methyltransferase family protein [Polyangiaceae bacterium]|jgi:5-methyltetrahydrofolate--homocysteine methyltransferase|nr:homocysteine S-methyltransferase family protein [Polyangiaceae bacterium]